MLIGKILSLTGFGNIKINHLIKLLVIVVTLLVSNLNVYCMAQQTENINLEKLNDSLKKGFILKNVRAYREVYFTKPQTWRVLPSSALIVKFQHSLELLPNRSYLNIYINGRLLKKEFLDKTSTELKTISIPLPVASLGNYNSIRFEVEQHYTDKCEDPLDHSLWTKIQEDTHISFNYSIIQPQVDLAKYPFPVVDPFSYGTTLVNFVVPKPDQNTALSLNALGIISSDIAQKISWRKLKFTASLPDQAINNNLNNVLIGTPVENPAILKLNSYLGNVIKNTSGTPQFTDKNGNVFSEESGLIYYINNPNNKNRAILIVTGNSANGVNLAARYLANETLAKYLKGKAQLITEYNPSKESPNTIAKYIHNRSLSLKELGFEDIKAERIGPPPIEYPIRVIPDLKTATSLLSLNLVFSYSPNLNDELSSLEVKFNDISLKGIKLDNINGETNKTLSIDIPAQYVKPFNKLSVTFHLFPKKFLFCQNYYDDNIWGTVSKDSTFNLPSDAKIIFPNLGLLNDQFYPYTTVQDLSNTIIIIPTAPALEDYQALLNVIGAVARASDSDGGINLITTSPNFVDKSALSDRNVILIGTMDSNTYIGALKDSLYLKFEQYYKLLTPQTNKTAMLTYADNQGILEQVISSMNPDKVITVVNGKTSYAVNIASTALSDKEKLETILGGNFYTLDEKDIKEVTIPKEKQIEKQVSAKKAGNISTYWPPSSPLWWGIDICGGIIILFIIMTLFRVIVNILFGRKGK